MNRALNLMTGVQAAKFLGVTEDTLCRWNKAKNGPPRRLIGKRFYYQRSSLTQWLESAQLPNVLVRRSVPGTRPVASQSTLQDSLRGFPSR